MNRTFERAVLAATLLGGAALIAQISDAKHPHLFKAQEHGKMAYQELTAAQQANDYDMGGHAQKAKDLLVQANHELDLAVQDANKNHK